MRIGTRTSCDLASHASSLYGYEYPDCAHQYGTVPTVRRFDAGKRAAGCACEGTTVRS